MKKLTLMMFSNEIQIILMAFLLTFQTFRNFMKIALRGLLNDEGGSRVEGVVPSFVLHNYSLYATNKTIKLNK